MAAISVMAMASYLKANVAKISVSISINTNVNEIKMAFSAMAKPAVSAKYQRNGWP